MQAPLFALNDGIVTGVRQVLEAVGALAAFVILAWAGRRATRRWLTGRKMRADLIQTVVRAVYVGVIAVGLFVAISVALGQTGTAFAGVLVTAFVTGIGLQDLLKNYVAGFYLLLEGNFRPGSSVRTDTAAGVITDIRLRSTFLRTDDGELVVVPNNDLFNKAVLVAGHRHPADGAPDSHPADGAVDQPSVEGAQNHPA
ncbi:MAG: mechanosensitive ion channel family protein [Candidatus Dormibacteraeota bacterium]|nr:mechanosensitive ion channel family protein [Candidatus Dormibacteraeota bacterium]